jgi:Spy/CpxP family protein refolding chaperone
MKERIETIKVWKLTESLDLSTEQSQDFFPVYNKLQDDRRAIEDERRRTMRDLISRLEQAESDKAQISRILDKLDGYDDRIQALKLQFRTDLKDILTIQQTGKLYVFEMQFRNQMREIIQDARKGMRRGRFPGQH